MQSRGQNVGQSLLAPKCQFALVALAAAAFHIAFSRPALSALILIYLGCLIELTCAQTPRLAFYSGLTLGVLVFAPKLTFFYTIFGMAAVPLWLVIALWHALFVHAGQRARTVLPRIPATLLLPILWTGFEYFRSELYPLKFSWLAPSFAFSPTVNTHILGSYGTTLLLLLICAALTLLPRNQRTLLSILTLGSLFALLEASPTNPSSAGKTLRLAGMQLEFPVELEVPAKLDLLKQKHPDADIYVLSEYTFDGPVPNRVRAWCRRNSKYLVVGGKDPAPNHNFYNTAFVIDPNGDMIFKQGKVVPIQFFKDGLPAPEQKLWNSPWGKIGLCVCYDLSYTRVMDRLIRQGAQIIINPTMDVADWGAAQHQLHSLIPPTRAAEYRIPIFRLASSGISQAIDANGHILATVPFAVEELTLSAEFPINSTPTLPLDRLLAPIATAITGLFLLFLAYRRVAGRVPSRRAPPRARERANQSTCDSSREYLLAARPLRPKLKNRLPITASALACQPRAS